MLLKLQKYMTYILIEEKTNFYRTTIFRKEIDRWIK